MSVNRQGETCMSGSEGLGPVLVTGAARRIGLALAKGFAEGRAPGGAARFTPLHAGGERGGGGAAGARRPRGDRRGRPFQRVDTRGLIERAESTFGPLTLLVNNASVFEPDSAEDFSLEVYERQMAINLRAPLLLAQGFAARLPPGAEGAIVNVIDQRVWRLTPHYFTYTLTKSALWGRDASPSPAGEHSRCALASPTRLSGGACTPTPCSAGCAHRWPRPAWQ